MAGPQPHLKLGPLKFSEATCQKNAIILADADKVQNSVTLTSRKKNAVEKQWVWLSCINTRDMSSSSKGDQSANSSHTGTGKNAQTAGATAAGTQHRHHRQTSPCSNPTHTRVHKSLKLRSKPG